MKSSTVAVTAKPPVGAPHFTHLHTRWLFLLAILAIEVAAIIVAFERPVDTLAGWSAWLFANSHKIWQVGVWSTGTVLLALSPQFSAIVSNLRKQPSGYPWLTWLAWHTLALVAFIIVTGLVFGKPTDPSRLSAAWLAVWLTLASATFLLWLLAIAPGRFWLRLVRQQHGALLMGVLLGIGVWMLVGMLTRQEAPLAQKELWSALSGLTLQLVYLMLGWFYTDLVYEPETASVGTASFPVEITYACSGIEGISLVILFLALYLWLFRKDLHFPQALWLLPIGIVAIWLANAIRITALIAIGTSLSPAVAGEGFHSHAGWVAFTLVAFGAIVLSHRMHFLSVAKPGPPVFTKSEPLAAALLVPFMVLMAASMVTTAFSAGFEAMYPLKVLAAGGVLWYYRRAYSRLGWSCSWHAIGIGVAVFLLWIALEPSVDSSKTELGRGVADLSTWAATVWLTFRVLGSVIIVPLVEELAFRSYILRKLIARDFEKVSVDQFTWLSFLASSALFGLLHGRWLAGTLAGMAYALALYRRGQLGDAVLAHATTNALIAVSVLVYGRWALWS